MPSPARIDQPHRGPLCGKLVGDGAADDACANDGHVHLVILVPSPASHRDAEPQDETTKDTKSSEDLDPHMRGFVFFVGFVVRVQLLRGTAHESRSRVPSLEPNGSR